MTSTLDREKLIQTIVKYRGIKEYVPITDYKEDGLMLEESNVLLVDD